MLSRTPAQAHVLAALVALGLALGTACSSTPAAPAPSAEAGTCNAVGAACNGGGVTCCETFACDQKSSLCCAVIDSKCSKDADCCNSGPNFGCVQGICSSRVAQEDAGVNDAAPPDAAPKSDAAIGCYDPSGVKPLLGSAPESRPGHCTDTLIATFQATCLGSGASTTACQSLTTANPACGLCLFGGQSGAPVPAFMPSGQDSVAPNLVGCATAVLGIPGACGAEVSKLYSCTSWSCGKCTTEAESEACETEAVGSTGLCRALHSAGSGCAQIVADRASEWTSACKGANAVETYGKVAKEMCGTR